MISHIWCRSQMKDWELSTAVKLFSLKLYQRVGESPGRIPWLNEKGLVLPSNKKNWNTFLSQRMLNTGTQSPCCVLFQQQATTLICGQNWCKLLLKGCLTITFRYHLSNHIHSLLSTTNFELDLYKKSRNRTKCPEVIFNLASCSYTAIEDRFWQISKRKTKLRNQVIKDLKTTVWVSLQ